MNISNVRGKDTQKAFLYLEQKINNLIINKNNQGIINSDQGIINNDNSIKNKFVAIEKIINLVSNDLKEMRIHINLCTVKDEMIILENDLNDIKNNIKNIIIRLD